MCDVCHWRDALSAALDLAERGSNYAESLVEHLDRTHHITDRQQAALDRTQAAFDEHDATDKDPY